MSLLFAARDFLKARIDPARRHRLRAMTSPWLSRLYRHDLKALAAIHGTDKWNCHWYAQHYERFFKAIRKKPLTLLEIGIGGYDNPDKGGASLRMWKDYFPNAHIAGLDLEDKSGIAEKRIETFRGDQSDPDVLKGIIAKIGRPDIIVDDGSHINQHVIASFKVLFPLLKDTGIYAVEDTQTSYWPDFGGNVDNQCGETMMNYFKELADAVNYQEFPGNGELAEFGAHITALHFYHNLVIIEKGSNVEGAAWANRDGQTPSH